MNYKSFNLEDWIGHINGVIEDETTLDGNEMRDLVEFLSGLSKTGRWINITNKNGTVIAVRCDCCGNSPKHAIRSEFCPNCGVKMVE